MKFIADLHIHSRFSMATSRDLCLGSLHAWAQRKGITIVGTGDFTHPGWFAELQAELEPAEAGLYRLLPLIRAEAEADVPASCRRDVRFMLTAEISSIYKKNGKTRKVHNLLFARDFETAGRIRDALGKIGNISSDGRPILKLDSKDLLKLVVAQGDSAFLVPAHIWTPHFSVLGAFSGFDSIEECFEELTPHVFAVETGLSSDPAMNWRLSVLDRFSLISNSDAHSPGKLGREANLFNTELSFDGMLKALKKKEDKSFVGTLEFFPQEGKYHYDGHRACRVRLTPAETKRHNGRCPSCGKKITLGVCHRVDALADRAEGFRPAGAPPFESLIPLKELLADALNVGAATKRVARAYDALLEQFGDEFHILREVPVAALEQSGIPHISEVIRRLRAKEVHIAPGYDGEFGTVTVIGPKPLHCGLTIDD